MRANTCTCHTSSRPSQEAGAVLAATIAPTVCVPVRGKLVIIHHLFAHLNGTFREKDDFAIVGIDIHHFRVRVGLREGTSKQRKEKDTGNRGNNCL